jgi:anti-anti-sigma factor
MSRSWEQMGVKTVYHLAQDLVASVLPEIRQELNQLIKGGCTHLVIDLTGVQMIDSSGIGILVAAHNSLNQRNGKLEIINVSDDLFELFGSMRLNQHFSIQRSPV